MRIQTFKNHKGLIYGTDSKRIGCDKDGILRIGTAEVNISAVGESVMPVILNGCTGTYTATFTDKNGEVFELERVTLKEGRIVPPPQQAVDFMELRCRAELLEEQCKALSEEITELRNIFDTNSLNFLIK